MVSLPIPLDDTMRYSDLEISDLKYYNLRNIKEAYFYIILTINKGPGPGFEPSSRDPQSLRITTTLSRHARI